ncbi:hypothetical protein SG34_000920 [Thalassomonas viridans]|uniref:Uncharacterized protein n=1 Tax=Thalassomonas viridans TaxID=137584 RepID=A0AAE9Z3W2_9GAMM|nr:hypothetical protein [Thalassomonas viridans]WDE05544.1 hypothetical protein SG34_000920 [Thalassomonas viridans]
MAKTNDMPEFHSVKVFVTENTRPRRRHGFANTCTAGITSPHGFIGCSSASSFIGSCFIDKNVSLTFVGGQAHV